MIGASPQEMFQMALRLPEAKLIAVLQGRSQELPQDVAFAALKKKRQLAVAAQGEQAGQQLAAGVTGLPAGGMEFADGGIVAFSDAGTVRMDKGGLIDKFYSWWNAPSAQRPEYPVSADNYGSNVRVDWRTGKPVPVVDRRMAPAAWEVMPSPTSPVPATGARQTTQAQLDAQTYGWTTNERGEPVPMDMSLVTEPPSTAPATAAARTGRASPQPAGVAAMINPLVPNEFGAPSGAGMRDPGIQGLLSSPGDEAARIRAYADAAREMTAPEAEALRKLREAQRAEIEGDKEGRLNTARGLAALQAAEALTRPGQHRAAAWGSAFGAAGREGEKYVKEERAIAKELRAADMAGAQAELAARQGDVKLGAELMSQQQTRTLKAADLAYTHEYRRIDAELKARGIDETTRHNMATEAAERLKLQIMAPLYQSEAEKNRAMAGHYASTASQDRLFGTALTQVRTMLQKELETPGTPTARKAEIRKLIDDPVLMHQFTKSLMTGEPWSMPSRSIQIPDSAIKPGVRIHE